MRPAADVLVVGDALLDVHVVPSRPPRPGGDVPAEIRLEAGGQGANVAVRLARRGVSVRLACVLGPDAAGDLLRERLAADGVELMDLGAAATGTVVVLLDASRERTMFSRRVPLAPGLASAEPLDVGWLVVSGYLLLEPDAGIPAAGAARRRVLLGCSLDPGECDAWVAAATALAPHLVVLNADEARALCGDDRAPAALAACVGERLGALTVVTHPGGAATVIEGRPLEVHAEVSAPPVDATGAGDAFAAGLVARLVDKGWRPSADDLGRAMSSAADLAAAVARVPGAQAPVAGEGA